MGVGIDALHFYTPRYMLDLRLLARERAVDPQKYLTGLGQEWMSIAPPDEDIVTMAATAATDAIRGVDPHSIAMVLFATESAVDHSKAAGVWVHHLLELPRTCRVVEVKQACYSGVCALQLALPYIRQHPDKKVLLLTSDIARYGLNTPGEPTQGAAACAALLSASPRLVAIEPEAGYYTDHVMDFWRPTYLQEAIVDGKYSTRIYLTALGEAWAHYQMESKRALSDHARFCYHTPFARMAQKAHERLVSINDSAPIAPETLARHINASLVYGKKLGNSYTASLFISLASLLEQTEEDLSSCRIGLFSYGSGCVAEYFSALVQPGYRRHLATDAHALLLSSRRPLSIGDYEQFYQYALPQDEGRHATPRHRTGAFRFQGVEAHERLYERCPLSPAHA